MAELVQKTIGQLLKEQSSKYAKHEAVVYPDRDLRMTYEQFYEKCRTVAKGLMALGIEKGENIAVWTTNIPEWVQLQFASGLMGAPIVTVNTNYRQSELEYLLKQSDTTTLILMSQYRDHSFIETVQAICPELVNHKGELHCERLPHLKRVILIDGTATGALTWQDVLQGAAKISDEALDDRHATLTPDDVINIQYTSGTTGFPKGVMLTHSNLVNNAINIAECMRLTDEDRLCIPVPFFHCFGCVIGTLAIVSVGGTMVPVQEFSPDAVLAAIEKERCTAVHGVPTMFISKLNSPNFEKYDVSTLRTGVMAGSTCPVEVMKAVIDKMGMTDITICYGQTESSPVITQTRVDDDFTAKVETVGRALANVEVKIVHPGTDQEVAPNEQGELCTRGYHVMKGYYNNEEETNNVIDAEGWLHTGDLATMDENGFVRVTGRLKDMIIRGGENIYPREIEEFLYTHPKIFDVQVAGVPDVKYGEEVVAWIIVHENVVLTEEEVREFCKGQISRHKIPRYIHFLTEYPMTASGKIQKFKLREDFISNHLG
ncbi:putative acyl-CoA synthetase YngI [Lysinibacillus alkalisoli]|uniref:Acyl-CoA synthetase YngI n=1 Tax=Lysinibacillus alkalisoli TaxID=1911548 RepID=A0A917D4W9_9BACI|nr:AMP-binding protein [Lysinibacillus alkalisoli]GGG12024.1 putative acyl-CoA synthetase YngI [Lysinibacillus alkalisoli]